MKKRIFRNIFFTAVVAALLVAGCFVAILYGSMEHATQDALRWDARTLCAAMDAAQQPLKLLQSLPRDGARITWIDENGTVLYDSAQNPGEMDDHSTRPEVQQALQYGEGESARYSDTLGEKTFYYAVALQKGGCVRVARTQRSELSLLAGLSVPLIGIVALIGIAAALLSRKLSERIVRPINELNLDDPINSNSGAYDELGPLQLRLYRQNRQIQEQMEQLRAREKELGTITQNMREGLALLDEEFNVLHLNHSAAVFFGRPEGECLGQYVFALHRSEQLQEAMHRAALGEQATEDFMWGDRWYRLVLSPVRVHGRATGYVLLLMDITQQHDAQQLRREFTANVSHELKTPLTSILGYAEIMQNGLARPEDTREFSGRIHAEASRLIALVEDILELSRLEEQRETELGPVELFALCQSIAKRLEGIAQQSGIQLVVQGGPASVAGDARVLEEMVYNLCDNAIKYNRPGGHVWVQIEKTPTAVQLRVKDDGIGIPPEHHEKVFERFYRVDKSHSRKTGGTGLGLSIVKHGAMLHHAAISLQSQPQGGTQITLSFPLPAQENPTA